MINALRENAVLGVKTSIDFMIKCLEHPEFIKGNTFTDFINKYMQILPEPDKEMLDVALVTASVYSDIQTVEYNGKSVQSGNGLSDPWLSIGNWELWNI